MLGCGYNGSNRGEWMPTLNATIGGEDANSYVTLQEADAYADQMMTAATWAALDDDTKTRALIAATAQLETLEIIGDRCTLDPPQRLQLPVENAECKGVTAACDMIPEVFKTAEVRMATEIAANPGILNPGDVSGPIKRQKLDVLEQEFFEPSGRRVGEASPYALQSFPWLADWLGCWYVGQVGSSAVLDRC